VKLLDLFCGAGGAAMGYSRTGFEVVGVDIEPQPNFPFTFHQADALTFPLDGFDAIHASPPCQAHSQATSFHPGARETHADLIAPTRDLLLDAGVPFVIENVPGAPIRKDVLMCGEMFGLRLHRHRYFETEGFFVMQPRHAPHHLRGATTNGRQANGHARLVAGHFADLPGAAQAMGIDWMTRAELAQAIPPSFTEHIGGYLAAEVQRCLGEARTT